MKSISTIAVLGAGTMGRGIAQVAAQGGYRTCLFDVAAGALDKAQQNVQRTLDKGVKLGKVAAADAEATLGRLGYQSDLAAYDGAFA